MRNRILSALLALLIFPICASAQDVEDVQLQEIQTFDFYSHQISIGYGFGSAAKWLDSYSGSIASGHLYGDDRYWGEINMKYLYRYSDLITFGLGYTYTGMRRDITSYGRVEGHSAINISIIMPEFKCDWYNNGIITLYSRAAVGVAIATLRDDYKDETSKDVSTTWAKFAFQASPIGFEVGKAFAFYVEAGFGYQGIIITGFRYSF